jgi:hypothetical protein
MMGKEAFGIMKRYGAQVYDFERRRWRPASEYEEEHLKSQAT